MEDKELLELYTELLAMHTDLVKSLPKCRPWVRGSGGHKVFGNCPHIALWQDDDASPIERYCDEHIPDAYKPDKLDYLSEEPWAEPIRKLFNHAKRNILLP